MVGHHAARFTALIEVVKLDFIVFAVGVALLHVLFQLLDLIKQLLSLPHQVLIGGLVFLHTLQAEGVRLLQLGLFVVLATFKGLSRHGFVSIVHHRLTLTIHPNVEVDPLQLRLPVTVGAVVLDLKLAWYALI